MIESADLKIWGPVTLDQEITKRSENELCPGVLAFEINGSLFEVGFFESKFANNAESLINALLSFGLKPLSYKQFYSLADDPVFTKCLQKHQFCLFLDDASYTKEGLIWCIHNPNKKTSLKIIPNDDLTDWITPNYRFLVTPLDKKKLMEYLNFYK